MDTYTTQARIEEVTRIFEEYGLGNPELLASWNGEDIEHLANFLTEEEFQTLIDELQDRDA